ncbi:cobalt-precorrin-3b C17-methyltransferase [Halalkalibacter wakoensis JCM 9140]|uniref:Cobalt-precorrin-3b C17-methyltransferase n=3 Tax=Halalkalibacter TaxID=2893056 RepID=W4QIX2_9BACI|nr:MULTISPECIES: nitrite reductase [Halalkalibacter]KHF37920.1 nitrite reductase [Halalkalibacter okhensis]GAE27658.1 cobalt-precorrin-3b C17-methyltransferase [Halalkalibacter wakoensis JCM 9140]GAE32031.1 cobalt-precorrin-3b C17-methyltransferase [Halalkalibacter hemicellulosilyticusJCM 9152]
MSQTEKLVKLAVNAGISFGAKLNAKQLRVLAEYMNDDQELELTTFQQLYIDVSENKLELVKGKFTEAGLICYPVGSFVKSLRTCNFCKGSEEEGMPVAIELNKRIAGREVPFTLKPAYTGCRVGCGEPLINDIGIIKVGTNEFDLYIGGTSKGADAKVGTLFKKQLVPEQLYAMVDDILDLYHEFGKKREPFFKFINRFGFENLQQQVLKKR